MHCRIGKRERIEVPEEFEHYLTGIFGVNQFGSPIMRIAWAQTELVDMISPDGTHYIERYIGNGDPCWMIERWRPAELFGTPESYYETNADPVSGLCMLGEYPHFGMYEVIVSLMHRKYNPETRELEIKTLPLDWEIIERVIPVLIKAEEMTNAEIREAREHEEARENAELVTEIAERMSDSLPTFYGPTSHAAVSSRTALITRKMEEVERMWKRLGLERNRHRPVRGFFQQ